MNRLLITGATGFLGQWTLRHWRAAHPETQIWATSAESSYVADLVDEFRVLDLRDAGAIRRFILECRPHQVIHLAGLIAHASLADHLAINVLGTENVYLALAELEQPDATRIVQAGTAAIYGPVRADELPVSENNPPRPSTAYAISKTTQDHLAVMFGRKLRLRIIRTRIFNMVGPGQPSHLVPATFIDQVRKRQDNEPLRVGNLSARRDFVDVRDVAHAFDSLLKSGQAGRPYNIGSGASVSIGDVLRGVLCLSGVTDVTITEDTTRTRHNDVPDVYADTTAIASDTGWCAKTPLAESLLAMWNS